MKFSSTQIKIKSSWLNWHQSIFERISYQDFFVYVNLHRFRTHQTQEQDTFMSSLSFLRKTTGYGTKDVLESLKNLHSENMVCVDVSRWDYFIDKSKSSKKKTKYNDHHIFVAYTLDKPNLYRENNRDHPVSNDDYYITINTDVFEYYYKVYEHTDSNRLKPDRLVAFYCILNKHNNNPEKKSNMAIYKMAKAIGFSKDFVNNMIDEMNDYGLLISNMKKSTLNRNNYEHVVATNMRMIDQSLIEAKEEIEQEKTLDEIDEEENQDPKQDSDFNPFDDVSEDELSDSDAWGHDPNNNLTKEEREIFADEAN